MKDLNKYLKNFDTNHCKYILKKNGKFKFFFKNFDGFLCFTNNIYYTLNLNKNIIFNRDEKERKKKYDILKKIQNDNNYFIYKNDDINILFNRTISNIYDILFMTMFLTEKKRYLNYFSKKYINNELIRIMIYYYLNYRNNYNKKYINDNDIFIKIFYNKYIYIIDIDRNIKEFTNFHELYKYLKNEGFVDHYYDSIVPKVKIEYKKIYKKIILDKLYFKFKQNEMKKIIPFKELDLSNIFSESE